VIEAPKYCWQAIIAASSTIPAPDDKPSFLPMLNRIMSLLLRCEGKGASRRKAAAMMIVIPGAGAHATVGEAGIIARGGCVFRSGNAQIDSNDAAKRVNAPLMLQMRRPVCGK